MATNYPLWVGRSPNCTHSGKLRKAMVLAKWRVSFATDAVRDISSFGAGAADNVSVGEVIASNLAGESLKKTNDDPRCHGEGVNAWTQEPGLVQLVCSVLQLPASSFVPKSAGLAGNRGFCRSTQHRSATLGQYQRKSRRSIRGQHRRSGREGYPGWRSDKPRVAVRRRWTILLWQCPSGAIPAHDHFRRSCTARLFWNPASWRGVHYAAGDVGCCHPSDGSTGWPHANRTGARADSRAGEAACAWHYPEFLRQLRPQCRCSQFETKIRVGLEVVCGSHHFPRSWRASGSLPGDKPVEWLWVRR